MALARTLLLLPLAAAVACDGAPEGAPSDGAGRAVEEDSARVPAPSGSACALDEAGFRYLRLPSGAFAYVEPQALLPAPGGFLLAGQPSYTARVDEAGRGAIEEERPFFGLLVRGDAVTPLEQPPGVPRPEWVRGAPDGGGGWTLLFDDVAPSAGVVGEPRAVRVAGVDESGAWGHIEALPAVSGGTADGAATASLTVGPDGPQAVVVHTNERSERDVLRFRHRRGAWSVDTLWARWVDEAVLHRARGGAWLAVSGLAPELEAQLAAVRVVSADGGGEVRHVVGRPGERFRSLTVAGIDRVDVGWISVAPDGPSTAWIVPHGTRAGARPVDVGEADRMAAAPVSDSATVWITSEPSGLGASDHSRLALTLVRAEGTLRLGSVENPFTGPFAALMTSPDTLVVVGPEARFGVVGSFVRSLVLRFRLSCT